MKTHGLYGAARQSGQLPDLQNGRIEPPPEPSVNSPPKGRVKAMLSRGVIRPLDQSHRRANIVRDGDAGACRQALKQHRKSPAHQRAMYVRRPAMGEDRLVI